MTPRKNFEKKSPLDTKTHYTDEEKIAKFPPQIPFLFPSEKSNQFGCHPSKNIFWKKHQNAHYIKT